MHSQITRIRNKDGSETLKRRSDGLTLAYSAPNLTTMLTGITDPLFVLKRIDNNGTTQGITYPYKYEPGIRENLPLLVLIVCGIYYYQIQIDLSNSRLDTLHIYVTFHFKIEAIKPS